MGSQKKPRAKTQFCTNCGQDVNMEVVRKGRKGDVTWLKCTSCGGFFPLVPEDLQKGVELPTRTVSLEEDLRSYSPRKMFFIGEMIYHPGFDDLGRVIDKEISGSGNRAIVVSFAKSGKKRLIEGGELQI